MNQDELDFINVKLNDIYIILNNCLLTLKNDEKLTFIIMSPDLNPHLFNGEVADYNGQFYIHRNLKCWLDLAETLNCRMLIPENLSDGLVKIKFQKLSENSWHSKESNDVTEKYGSESVFFRLDKSEEAAFLYDFTASVKNLNLTSSCKVLNLGCHRGIEFKMLNDLDSKIFQYANFTGIDHSQTAINQALKDFPECRFCFAPK